MYLDYFGLREAPFELTPNPKYLFLTRQHREALTTLQYGLGSAKGVIVLIGEAGTGKTTLLRAALESDRCRNVNCVYLNNPTLTRDEFIEILSTRFGLSARASVSKAALLGELEQVLRQSRARGQVTALVLDEAQSFSDELLEEIRLLANTETTTEKLLPLVIAGQPELKDRLNETGLRQLKQRVTLRCEITPFSQQDTAAYIAQRLSVAGGDPVKLFSREAVMLIHEKSAGIPRTISVICDNCLLTTLGLGRRLVDSSIVHEVAHDFDLHGGMLWSSGHSVEHHADDEPSHHELPRASTDENAGDGREARPFERSVTRAAKLDHEAPVEVEDDHDRELFVSPRKSRRFSIFGR